MPPLVSSLLLMKLKEGVYENLISDRLLDDMRQTEAAGYVNQSSNGRRFLLFVREDKKDGFGNTSPYYCMGLLDYVSSHGNYPMNIEWELRKPASTATLRPSTTTIPRFISTWRATYAM